MEDQFNLKRFIDAQFSTYERALDEIKMVERQVIGCGLFSLSTMVLAEVPPQ